MWAAWCLAAGLLPTHAQTQLPAGFSEEQLLRPGEIAPPTSMAFAPDGRLFICEQAGRVRLFKNGVLAPTPFLSVDTIGFQERGLTGITFDPNFADNGWVYVYYTASTPTFHNRVSRFTASGDLALPGSEVVLQDFPTLGESAQHNAGALHFGPDGKLFVAIGDNLRSTNSASMETVLGKILRINPDGSIPSDNPFFATASGQNRAIWALGLRNPFTFAFQPGSGLMFINDVGLGTWEEINLGRPGAHYGWPRWEGPSPDFDRAYQTPFYAYRHPTTEPMSSSITGGTFYQPATPQFPAEYVGQYFFMDGSRQWIRTLNPATAEVRDFAPRLGEAPALIPIYLTVGPEGSLYYLTHGNQSLFRIQYSGVAAPRVAAQPRPVLASVGYPADFALAAYGTGTLTYEWQRQSVGEGAFTPIPGATRDTYRLPAAALADHGAQFRCVVRNAAGEATSEPALLSVTTELPPVITLLAPAADATYRAGDEITFSATVTDAAGAPLPLSALAWRVVFHHHEHTHPFLENIPAVTSGTFTIPKLSDPSDDVWYRLHLTATNVSGLMSTVARDLRPLKSVVTLATEPPGLIVLLDGAPLPTPNSFTGVVGVIRSVGVEPQLVGGVPYEFAGWSDGGAVEHEFDTPATNATLVATFRPAVVLRDDAAFDSQAFQTFMSAGQRYPVSVTLKNVGTTTWTAAGGWALVPADVAVAGAWGVARVPVPATVPPGGLATFAFDVVAPLGGGVFPMEWRPQREGAGTFGEGAPRVNVTVGVVPSAAAFVSQNVPLLMETGRLYTVTIVMRNVGTNTWLPTNNYRLCSMNPRDNLTWGTPRAYLPGAVGPGANAVFVFNVLAPAAEGTFDFQWSMVQDGNYRVAGLFGDLTPNLRIRTTRPANNAVFIGQSVPPVMLAGQRYNVSISMLNAGSLTWTPEARHRLASDNPMDNTLWGGNRVFLSAPVAPGAIGQFNFTVRAPATNGPVNFQWRMVQEAVGFFGQPSLNVPVLVQSSFTTSAVPVSVLAPASVTAGQPFTASVTMRNSGTAPWPDGATVALTAINPANNATWGISSAPLPASVPSGGNATFTLNLTAPAAAGPQPFQWQLAWSGLGLFGTPTDLQNIIVVPPALTSAIPVSVAAPATLVAGASFTATVVMQNSGNVAWPVGAGYRLMAQNPAGNGLWGVSAVALIAAVAPGEPAVFTVAGTAPATAGSQSFQWQMFADGLGFFGDATAARSITVLPPAITSAIPVSVTAPTTLVAGQRFTATVVLRNNGNVTWPASGVVGLVAQAPASNAVWGVSRVPLNNAVAPGEETTFTISGTAPTVLGNYPFQWQMVSDDLGFFGDATSLQTIVVTAPVVNPGTAGNAAVFVSQSAPAVMQAGQIYAVSVTMRNVGTNTWTPAAKYRLASRNPSDNSTWGLSRAYLSGPVAPGATAVFTFTAKAPAATGSYNFQWRMVQDGVAFFGENSANLSITVQSTAVAVNAAAFVSQSVPTRLVAGQLYRVSLTFQNTGTTTWTSATRHRLGSLNPADNYTWDTARAALSGDVAPGRTATFTFAIKAPATPGNYNFQWSMLQEVVGRFGPSSPNLVLPVVAP